MGSRFHYLPIVALAAVLTFQLCPSSRAGQEQYLGSLLYSDVNLSLNRNQACASCHSLSPATNALSGVPFGTPGFVDPVNVATGTSVSAGSVSGKFGQLNAPSVGYAAFSPEFHWDDADGIYVGGQFWNGRATNLQAQATFPLLNPAEMAMPNEWAVVTRLQENTNYVQLFYQCYGLDLTSIPAYDAVFSNAVAPSSVDPVFKAAAQAISQFERQPSFNQFTSKFDYWQAGMTTLSSNELSGYRLFRFKVGCSTCHTTDRGFDANGNPAPPFLSNFSYANIGLPRNWNIPGTPPPDPGLGGRPDIAATDPTGSTIGAHKVMSLRNIAITPPYGHNGVFSNLEQVVHFYNTRDVLGSLPANTNAGFGVTGWPAPEVPQNVNTNGIGNQELTADEEADIVAFLKTLTDNYPATGGDTNVLLGTPSPYPYLTIPGISTAVQIAAPGQISVVGQLGLNYRIDYATNLAEVNCWLPMQTLRLGTNGVAVTDTNAVTSAIRFYRAVANP